MTAMFLYGIAYVFVLGLLVGCFAAWLCIECGRTHCRKCRHWDDGYCTNPRLLEMRGPLDTWSHTCGPDDWCCWAEKED